MMRYNSTIEEDKLIMGFIDILKNIDCISERLYIDFEVNFNIFDPVSCRGVPDKLYVSPQVYEDLVKVFKKK